MTLSRATAPRRRRHVGELWTCVMRTAQACFTYRAMGLAAETAFYALLSLPPLLFGLAGAIGFVAQTLDIASVNSVRSAILHMASRVLTRDAIDHVVTPTLDDLLGTGRADVISIGFLIAVWSGSRAIAVFVDTCTIMYGMRGRRGVITSRLLSLLIYVVFLIGGSVVLPLVIIGPGLLSRVLPGRLAFLNFLYWPGVGLASIALLATLYHVARPIRGHWYSDLPGAVLTFLMWAVGSWALRLFLTQTLGGVSLYGPLAAPIAVLMWLYLSSASVLIGAAFNASIVSVWPRFAGVSDIERQRLFNQVPAESVHTEGPASKSRTER